MVFRGLITLLIFSAKVAFASQVCTGIPSNSAEPAVLACESATAYKFTIAGAKTEYNKDDYQAAFHRHLQNWAKAKELPESAFAQAEVTMWLSVPEANPPGTRARAVVTTSWGELVVYMDIPLSTWEWDEHDMGVFEAGSSYPDSYGMRLGQLLVKKLPEVSLADLKSWLASFDANLGESFGGNWYVVNVPFFNELDVRGQIEADGKFTTMLEQLQANYIYEWIAWRSAVFRFTLGSRTL